ncbi:flavin reductase family protein [Sutterella sp.]|uniref:flavin reductase family protein n=1 Tax=Sutterella sp. TaxID=1981025 RepID=UPI0026E0803C|nr:flavin reductase [Sutterella sp.]MDO5532781.1 flavin reductase [Sutterella sp.]
MALVPLPLNDVFRCFNDGGLVLLGASDGTVTDVMPCGWCAPWGLDRALVTAGPNHFTRGIIERTGRFVLMTPNAGIAALVHRLGTTTMHEDPRKLESAGVELIGNDSGLPFVAGCGAWVVCRRVTEGLPGFPNALLFGVAEAAWVDDRLWRANCPVPPSELAVADRRVHYEAGGGWFTEAAREVVLTGAQGGRTG